MSIIQTLKDLIGYSGTDLDVIFAIISIIVVMYFVFTMFNIINSMFKRRY